MGADKYSRTWKTLHKRFRRKRKDLTLEALGLLGDFVVAVPIKKTGDWKRITPTMVLRNDLLAVRFLSKTKEEDL